MNNTHNKLSEKLGMMVKGQKKSEIVLYVTLWTILFAASAFSVYADDSSFDWSSLLDTWQFLAVFSLTFFVHNFFVAPMLVYRNRKWRYGVFMVSLLALFMGYQMVRMANVPPKRDNPKAVIAGEGMPGRVPPMMDHRRGEMPGSMEKPFPPNFRGHPQNEGGIPHLREDGHNPMKARPFGGPGMVASTIMFLLLGLNVGTKYYFKSLDDRKRMKELEKDNLNQQLQYLKYQINPHFFMNTLNNIHALVDIDPEEAKHTIEVLSKLMRYVLYDADKPMATLRKELDFLRHYVDLMRIRYTDKVNISVSLPSAVPDVQVPSLLFATFVENAFKHGVSYQKNSYIEVSVRVDEKTSVLEFVCNNSKKPVAEEKQTERGNDSNKKSGGVGLQNAYKRLNLIYGRDYQLTIDACAEDYRVLLRLPV